MSKSLCKLSSGGAKESNLPLSEFAIIAAYKAQKSEYEKGLSVKAKFSKEWGKVDGGTIDEMEGRETGVEILDLTITAQAKNNKTQLGVGFLKDDRRINVAATRARYGLIILTDREYLRRVGQGAKGMKALGVHLKGRGRLWEGFRRLDVSKSVGTKQKRGLDV
jgi:superfamily I DNA and/or RNA helicase